MKRINRNLGGAHTATNTQPPAGIAAGEALWSQVNEQLGEALLQ